MQVYSTVTVIVDRVLSVDGTHMPITCWLKFKRSWAPDLAALLAVIFSQLPGIRTGAFLFFTGELENGLFLLNPVTRCDEPPNIW